jgi:L-threonylcarbamoyladenylate synthase
MWVDLASPDPATITKAANVIRDGGIVFYPSDTIYGLGCDPFQPRAVQKVFAAKGRDEGKGVLLLVPSRDWVTQLAVEIPSVVEFLIDRFWPGPLTLLMRPRSILPANVIGNQGRVGMRCPDSLFLHMWLKELSTPLVSTSANISGSAPSGDLAVLRSLFQDKVDLFLEAGDLPEILPSTVVDVTNEPRIVRRGDRGEEVREALYQFCNRR